MQEYLPTHALFTEKAIQTKYACRQARRISWYYLCSEAGSSQLSTKKTSQKAQRIFCISYSSLAGVLQDWKKGTGGTYGKQLPLLFQMQSPTVASYRMKSSRPGKSSKSHPSREVCAASFIFPYWLGTDCTASSPYSYLHIRSIKLRWEAILRCTWVPSEGCVLQAESLLRTALVVILVSSFFHCTKKRTWMFHGGGRFAVEKWLWASRSGTGLSYVWFYFINLEELPKIHWQSIVDLVAIKQLTGNLKDPTWARKGR